MLSKRKLLAACVAGLVAHCALSLENCFANEPADPVAVVEQAGRIQQALHEEASGKPVNRRDKLQGKPQQDWVAWQVGLVKLGDQWKAAHELAVDNPDQEYLAKRQELAQDPECQLKLARWCQATRRTDLARAHFFAVVAADSNNAEARRGLGHVQAGGEWTDPAELKLVEAKVRGGLEAIEQYLPKLRPILENINSPKPNKANQALNQLDKIDTTAALPALVLAIVKVDDDLARLLVRKVAQSHTPESCSALVQIALAHPSPEIRRQAVSAIKAYPLELFVPQLLEQLSTEVTVESRMVVQPNGQAAMESIIKQELQDKRIEQNLKKSVDVLSSFFSRREVTHSAVDYGQVLMWSIRHGIPKENPVPEGVRLIHRRSVSGAAEAAAVYVPPQVLEAATSNLDEQGRALKLAAEQQNRAAKEQMIPIFGLLRETTGQPLEDDAPAWWDWWVNHNERYVDPLKPTQKSYQVSRDRIGLHNRNYHHDTSGTSYVNRGTFLVQRSCLVAGTQVQTSNGLVAVDEIRVGDRVLSQDPESGELSLQAVLLTTVRPPNPTIKIVTEGSIIQATGGHLWWVSGKGWTKSRDLEAGMYLHSSDGNVLVKELVEDSDPQPTYNLVVDRYHTYFVGPERVLSYDNTPVKPTLKLLPGYSKPEVK